MRRWLKIRINFGLLQILTNANGDFSFHVMIQIIFEEMSYYFLQFLRLFCSLLGSIQILLNTVIDDILKLLQICSIFVQC